MATVDQMEARLEALEEVHASGTLRVEYEGRSVTYRSMDELERAIGRLQQQIQNAKTGGRPKVGVASFGRG